MRSLLNVLHQCPPSRRGATETSRKRPRAPTGPDSGIVQLGGGAGPGGISAASFTAASDLEEYRGDAGGELGPGQTRLLSNPEQWQKVPGKEDQPGNMFRTMMVVFRVGEGKIASGWWMPLFGKLLKILRKQYYQASYYWLL